MKTLSFGTLGDSYIAFLKFRKLATDHHLFVTDDLHCAKIIHEWVQHPAVGLPCDISSEFVYSYCDCKDLGVWKERKEIDYILSAEEKQDTDPYINIQNDIETKYDICLQVSAGSGPINKWRQWPFDPLEFQKELIQKGYMVCLIGWDEKFKRDEPDNFVCKLEIRQVMDLVLSSKILISNIGFHSLFKLSTKGTVIYFMGYENYIYDKWKEHSYHMDNPTKEVICQRLLTIK